jgi:phage FluMu protein Com
MIDVRCHKCGRLLFKLAELPAGVEQPSRALEVKCLKCKQSASLNLAKLVAGRADRQKAVASRIGMR